MDDVCGCHVLGANAKACFFFQAEDGIRDLVRSRGLGDVYKRQANGRAASVEQTDALAAQPFLVVTDITGASATGKILSLIHI